MKKILLYIIALAGFMASCSNDEIDVTPIGDITLNVSTQSVYDDFDIADSFKQYYLGRGYKIGVFTYFYDSNGNLAASDSIAENTFRNVPMTYQNIPAGKYKVVTIEMLLDVENGNKSPNWLIVGQDKLNTLQIVNTKYFCLWSSAVGLDVRDIIVKQGDGDQKYTIMPKGIGSIISTYMTNFDKTNYNYVGLFTKDQPSGRLLSPYYSGEDRFVYNKYNDNNIWTPRGLAQVSDESIVDIYFIEEGTLKYIFGAVNLTEDDSRIYAQAPIGYGTFNVSDGKTYYAGYNYNGDPNNPVFTQGIFKTWSQYLNWFNSLNNTSSTITVVDPYLQWGSTYTQVNTYMLSKGLKYNDDEMDTENNLYWVQYVNSDESVIYQYNFNTSKTSLNSTLMGYDESKFTLAQILNKFKVSYSGGEYVSDLEGYLFYDNNNLAVVFESEDDEAIIVMYMPKTSSAPKNIKAAKKQLKLKK